MSFDSDERAFKIRNFTRSKAYWMALLACDGIFKKQNSLKTIAHDFPEGFYACLTGLDDHNALHRADLEQLTNADFYAILKGEIVPEGGLGAHEPAPIADGAAALPIEARNSAPPATMCLRPEIRIAPVEVMVEGEVITLYYDNYTHASGKLRAYISCGNVASHSNRCRCYRQVERFDTDRDCLAYLLAWRVHGSGVGDDGNVDAQERHRRFVPTAEHISAMKRLLPE